LAEQNAAKFKQWKKTQATAAPQQGPSNPVRGDPKASKGKEKATAVSGAVTGGDKGEGSSKGKARGADKGEGPSKARASEVGKTEGVSGGKKVQAREAKPAVKGTGPAGVKTSGPAGGKTSGPAGGKTVVIVENPRPKVHRPGGYMTPSNRRPSAGKASSKAKQVKSAEFVHSDVEEVEADKKGNRKAAAGDVGEVVDKGKRKAAAKATELVKAVGQADAEEGDGDDSEEDEDADGDGEQDEDEEDDNEDTKPPRKSGGKAPLDIVRERAAVKAKVEEPPATYVAGDDKDRCGHCEKAQVTCFWLRGALNKAGARACWSCKTAKRGCIYGFRNSGPTAVDLSTPLGTLVDRLEPPASESEGVPRAGILGEAAALPTTLGELLVDLLGEVRAVREENRELKRQINAIQRTLDTTSTYDVKYHQDVMERLEGIPVTVGHRVEETMGSRVEEIVGNLPDRIHARIMESMALTAVPHPAVSPLPPSPAVPLPPPSPVVGAALSPLLGLRSLPEITTPFGSPLSPAPDLPGPADDLELDLRDDLPGGGDNGDVPPAEDDELPPPRASLEPSSPPEDPEDPPVASIVANRTRTKTKNNVVSSPEVADGEGSGSDTPLQETVQTPRGAKRKASTPEDDGEEEGPKKKVKAAPKPKPAPRKPKAAPKKK
jgi:hypothetical protein